VAGDQAPGDVLVALEVLASVLLAQLLPDDRAGWLLERLGLLAAERELAQGRL
jgi:hypothetical protein